MPSAGDVAVLLVQAVLVALKVLSFLGLAWVWILAPLILFAVIHAVMLVTLCVVGAPL